MNSYEIITEPRTYWITYQERKTSIFCQKLRILCNSIYTYPYKTRLKRVRDNSYISVQNIDTVTKLVPGLLQTLNFVYPN